MLEVVIALAIVVIGLGAALSTSMNVTDGSYQLRARLYGLWAVQNRMEENLALSAWPDPGDSSGETKMGGINIFWKETVSDTDNPLFRKVVLNAYIGKKSDYSLAELTGYLNRYAE